MATIRKRILPSGKERWQVDFFDQAGVRRAKLFTKRKDADAFLVKARAQVASGSYLHDTESITLAAGASRRSAAHGLCVCWRRRTGPDSRAANQSDNLSRAAWV